MCAYDFSDIREQFKMLNQTEREAAIASLQKIVDEQLTEFAMNSDPEETVCLHWNSHNIIRFGKDDAGKQRYHCKDCRKTYIERKVGNILGNTKLPKETWLTYCRCFVNVMSVRATAKECEVSIPTSLFMRRRMLELISKCIPSFEVKQECRIEVDEMYISESFKGNHLRSTFKLPRKARKNGNAKKKRGLSNEQIAVMTGITDNRDFFFDVACRGNISYEVAKRVLDKGISAGSIIATDKHHSYIPAPKALGLKWHEAFESKTHKGLGHVNALHSKIERFLHRFNGVSTKWLGQYLAWFKWLQSFKGATADRVSTAFKNIISGSYETTRRKLKGVPMPFFDSDGNPVKC